MTAQARGPGAPAFAWTDEIEGEIFTRIGKGESLRDICEDDWLPSQTTIYRRLAADDEFRKRYTHAREVQADTIFDEILQIADDARNDWLERNGEDSAGWTTNGEHIQRSKLRIEARKWMAGKLRPKVYGEKLDIDHSSSDGSMTPITGFDIRVASAPASDPDEAAG